MPNGAAVHCPRCEAEMAFTPGQGWICGQCGYCIAPSDEDEDFETIGDLLDDEWRRIRSMSKPGGGRASGRRRKYRKVYAPPQPLNDDEETARLRAAQVKKLPLRLRKRHVMELQRRYAAAKTRREKSLIVTELEAMGYERSWARWRLRHPFKRAVPEVDKGALEAVLARLMQALTPPAAAR